MLFSPASGCIIVYGRLVVKMRVVLLAVFVVTSRHTGGLQVAEGNLKVVLGGTVTLPCKLTGIKESLTQISWQRKTRGKPQTDNFFTISEKNGPRFINGDNKHFKFVGKITEFNGSMELSNATMIDEGVYTCIFTLFPSGNHNKEIDLELIVPPVTSLKDTRPTLGNEEISLVSCTAASSKPPAEVKWNTGTLGEMVRPITNSTHHDNGTTTTISTLMGVPTKDINQQLVKCIVTNVELKREEILPFTIQIYFAPMEVTVISTPPYSFQCVTEANPPPSYTWIRPKGIRSESAVIIEDATLKIMSMTSDLNGVYQCEVSNTYGRNHGHLYLHVAEGSGLAAWILFSLLLSLNIGAAVWYFWRIRRTGERQPVPTASSPHEDRQAEETI